LIGVVPIAVGSGFPVKKAARSFSAASTKSFAVPPPTGPDRPDNLAMITRVAFR
jgi:hypothetical protein